MPAAARTLEETIAETVEAAVRRAVEPLRVELERLRGSNDGGVLVSYPEAALRLGISLRSVQQRVKDGRLSVEMVGGERMVRLPAALPPR